MAINRIKNVEEGTDIYNSLVQEIENAGDESLIIVARSRKNRKADEIKPINVKHGIFFYLAKEIPTGLAFLGKFTAEDVYKAKQNMARRCRLGNMFEILNGGGTALKDFEGIDNSMTVLTITGNVNGAGLMICPEILNTIKTKIGGFRILPSSIHELIIVPDDADIPAAALDGMVRDVNSAEVSDAERLADRSFDVDEWT